MPKKIYIISLGGSLIAPDQGINWKYLKDFRSLIISQIKKGNKFVITGGGGMTCRNYQNAVQKISKVSSVDLDWIGLYTCRLHAQVIRSIFEDYAHETIIEDPTKKIEFKKSVITGGGYKPGFSSDMSAVLLAKNLKAKTIINLSNIEYVYTKDPRKFKDAKIIKEISWSDFRKIIGNTWKPGINKPFDPIASQKAQKLGLEVVIAGKNLKNLENILKGKKFRGTIISD